MFSRIILMALVLVRIYLNFLVSLSPLLIISIPLLQMGVGFFNLAMFIKLLLWVGFITSALTVMYFILDITFGISVSLFSFRYKSYFFTSYKKQLEAPFKQIKKAFNIRNVKLLVEDSSEVNAYAMGGLGKKVIIVTEALLETIQMRCTTEEERTSAITAILGHEMSHIINADYLPGMILMVNDRITLTLQWVFNKIILLLMWPLMVVPFVGGYVRKLVAFLLNQLQKVINIINFTIIRKLYKFCYIYISRAIEYRSDKDAARACGGPAMASALTAIGNGYNSIFSLHPSTQSRIKRVQVIKVQKGVIRPNVVVALLNTGMIAMFIVVFFYLFNMLDIPQVVEDATQYYAIFSRSFARYSAKIQTLVNAITQIIS